MTYKAVLQPSWLWALPLCIKFQLYHSLNLTYPSMFQGFGNFSGFLGNPVNFSPLRLLLKAFKTQVWLVELNHMQTMAKEALRLAASIFSRVHSFSLVEILSSSSRECPTREPSLFMSLLALLICVLLMSMIVLMLGLLC